MKRAMERKWRGGNENGEERGGKKTRADGMRKEGKINNWPRQTNLSYGEDINIISEFI